MLIENKKVNKNKKKIQEKSESKKITRNGKQKTSTLHKYGNWDGPRPGQNGSGLWGRSFGKPSVWEARHLRGMLTVPTVPLQLAVILVSGTFGTPCKLRPYRPCVKKLILKNF